MVEKEKLMPSILKRITELEAIVLDEEGVFPHAKSKSALDAFLAEAGFTVSPVLTVDICNCYYLEIKKNENKLILDFREDDFMHYILFNNAKEDYYETMASFENFLKEYKEKFERLFI